MPEPTFGIHSDQRATGTGAPSADADLSADMEGLIVALLLQLLGKTPTLPVGDTNNPTNVAALTPYLTSTVSAVLSAALSGSSAPVAGAASGVATLDSTGLVPTSQLPITTQSLVLAGAGAPSSALGENGDTYVNQSTGQEYAKASGAWSQGSMVYWGQLATTGLSGVALTSTAGTVISWTAPSDGLMHRIIPIGQLVVGTAETGGAMTFSVTDPTNTLRHPSLSTAWATGGQAAGNYYAASSPYLVYPGTTVSVTYAALTAGTATAYLELWGS